VRDAIDISRWTQRHFDRGIEGREYLHDAGFGAAWVNAEGVDRRGVLLGFGRVGADYAFDPAAIRIVKGEARTDCLDNPGVGILGLDAQRVLRDDVIHGVPGWVVGEGDHYLLVRGGGRLRGWGVDASGG